MDREALDVHEIKRLVIEKYRKLHDRQEFCCLLLQQIGK